MAGADFVLLQLFNAVSLGVLYVLLASGLSLIFGVSDIINFAHGALYMLGAYIGLSVVGATGSFWLGLIVAPLFVAIVGVAIEVLTLRPIYGRDHLYQIVLTFGLALMIVSAVKWLFGDQPQYFGIPPSLSGVLAVGPLFFSRYKLFLILVGGVVTAAVWYGLVRTDIGLVLRAGAQRPQTVEFMGVNVTRYFTIVFALGSGLAGLAGALAGPYLSVTPQMGNSIIIVVFIVVILGGLGSFRGSVIAALLIGGLQTLESTVLSSHSGFLIYFAMIAVLVVRPEGILGEYSIQKHASKVSLGRIIPPIRPTDVRFLAAVGVLALVPLGVGTVYSQYAVTLVAIMFAWALLALSLDFVTGYLGLLSFGHAAFFGISAYTVALTVLHLTNSLVLASVFAIVLCAVVSWAIGALSVRLSGVYFAMITLAFAQLFYRIALVWTGFTGGSNGLNVSSVHLLGLPIGTTVAYYLGLVAVVGVYVVSLWVLDSRFGHAMKAIRESERRVSFLGYDTEKIKRRTFMLSGVFAGIGGIVFVVQQTFVSPGTLFWLVSGDGILSVMIGGLGTLFGPLIGAGVFVGFQQIVSSYTGQWQFFLGIILVCIALFAPQGIAGVYGDKGRILGRIRRLPQVLSRNGGDDRP